MRRLFLVLFLIATAHSQARADDAARQKIAKFFTGWYSYLPGSRVAVVESREVTLPGFEIYRAERQSESKVHRESNVVLYDRAKDEIFVGDVLHDPDRAAARRPLDAGDLANVQASLSDAFGVPVTVALAGEPRGALRPVEISIREDGDAFAKRGGFVSEDGATLLIGEFDPASESPIRFREALLEKNPGIRPSAGRIRVTEFLDFQCERCRKRTPEVRKALARDEGAVEVHLLPLVKSHDWAFAAAECAAALAAAGPELYGGYETAVFARFEGMGARAARELASDIAEAAGARGRFEEALARGEARRRVVADVELAMRLGVGATPAFINRGTLVSGEAPLVESYLWETGQTRARAGGGKSE